MQVDSQFANETFFVMKFAQKKNYKAIKATKCIKKQEIAPFKLKAKRIDNTK